MSFGKKTINNRWFMYCSVFCAILVTLVILVLKYGMHPVKSNGYPYAIDEIYSSQICNENIGKPYYVNASNINYQSVEKHLTVSTDNGDITLYFDDDSPFPRELPAIFNDVTEVFFVYCGWNQSVNRPYGYYLGAVNSENVGTDLPAYNEVRGYYSSYFSQTEAEGVITPTPSP